MKLKTVLAILVLATAGFIWARQCWHGHVWDEESLRNTTGVVVEVVDLQPIKRGCRVHWRIANNQPKLAAQVVLCIRLVSPQGQVIAANPLVSAAAVHPGEARELTTDFPAQFAQTNLRAQAEISLVRWQK